MRGYQARVMARGCPSICGLQRIAPHHIAAPPDANAITAAAACITSPVFALRGTFAHSVRHRTVDHAGPFRQQARLVTKRHIGRQRLCQPATHRHHDSMTVGTLY